MYIYPRTTEIMRKIALISAVLFVVFVSGCTNYGGNQTQTPSGGNSVNLQNFAFNPSTLTVKAGTTVTWTNSDSVAHTVTSDGGAFDSGNLAPDQTFSHTFNTAGTYAYHCNPHPSMKGTIIVQ